MIRALFLLLLMLQYTIPQHTGATAVNGGGGTTPTIDGTLTADATGSGTTVSTSGLTVPTSGDTIVVGVTARNSGTFTVTDSNSKTYTQIWTASDPTNPAFSAMFYLPNSASGALTVTATITVGGGDIAIWAQPIKGANATTPLDSTFSSTFVTASTLGSVANGACGTARTPGQSNTLVFSYGIWDNVTPSVGSGYTLLNGALSLWVQTQSQTTAASTTGAWVSAADDFIVGCAGFHS